MATMNKNVPFKDGDNLDLYLSTASEYTVDIENLIDYAEGRKFETIKEVGHAFEDGTFVGWEYARDIDVFKRLRSLGCRSIGVSNPLSPPYSELVGLIDNEEFYGAVTLKTLCAEKEYMDYVLKRNY
jgi:hypothetical protein